MLFRSPGIIDTNVKEMKEQYRLFEDIVTNEDIEKLMKIYNVGKIPLSLILGFGEATIPRYFQGKLPSKEYSDIIKEAISSPDYFIEKLESNKNLISDSTYKKVSGAVKKIQKQS